MKRREDGRLVKSVTDPRTGKRIYFYGKSEREINRKILEYREQATFGRTFSEVADEWWAEAEPNLASQTLKPYRPALRRAVETFGEQYIKDIKPKEISKYLKELSKNGFSAATIANQRCVINMVFKHAVLENDIEFNPCANVALPKETSKKARSAATLEDEAIVKDSYDVWLFPYIAIMTGMRKGEILALQWRDIDFDRSVIHVNKSVYHEGDRPFIKEPKTEAGRRVIPLLESLKKVLQGIYPKPDDAYIISDDGTKPLTNRRFITLYNHFRAETGIKCTAHQLRHSFATIAFEAGVPVKSVQEILGHKQLSTTMDIYTDFRKKSVTEAAKILNEKM